MTMKNKKSNLLAPALILVGSSAIAYSIFRRKNSNSGSTSNGSTSNGSTSNSGSTYNSGNQTPVGTYISDIVYLSPRVSNHQIIDENITEIRLKNENNPLKLGDKIQIIGTDYDGVYTVIDRWTDGNKVKTVMVSLRSGLPKNGKFYNNAKLYLVSNSNTGGGGSNNGWNLSNALNTISQGIGIAQQVGLFGNNNQQNTSSGGGNFIGDDDYENKFNY